MACYLNSENEILRFAQDDNNKGVFLSVTRREESLWSSDFKDLIIGILRTAQDDINESIILNAP